MPEFVSEYNFAQMGGDMLYTITRRKAVTGQQLNIFWLMLLLVLAGCSSNNIRTNYVALYDVETGPTLKEPDVFEYYTYTHGTSLLEIYET